MSFWYTSVDGSDPRSQHSEFINHFQACPSLSSDECKQSCTNYALHYVTGPGQAFRKQVSLHAISEQMAGEIETGE